MYLLPLLYEVVEMFQQWFLYHVIVVIIIIVFRVLLFILRFFCACVYVLYFWLLWLRNEERVNGNDRERDGVREVERKEERLRKGASKNGLKNVCIIYVLAFITLCAMCICVYIRSDFGCVRCSLYAWVYFMVYLPHKYVFVLLI